MDANMSSDRAANLVLQELHQAIAGHMDVDCITPLLYQKRFLSLKKLQYLQGNLTDLGKKEYLLNNVLMNGGYAALKALLDVLDETSQQLQQHANLAVKLRKQYHDKCNQIDQGLTDERPLNNSANNTDTSSSTQSVPQLPDIIPQFISQLAQSFGGNTPSSVTTRQDSHNSASGPACNYFMCITGSFNPSHYSSSLNDDTHDDHMRQSSSSKTSRCASRSSFTDPTISNYKFEGIDEEPDECFTTQQPPFVDSSPKEHLISKQHHVHCHHDTMPAMFANEPPSGVAASRTKQINVIMKAKDIGSNRHHHITKSYNLDEFDVLSVLNKSTEPLSDMKLMKVILLGESGVGKTSIKNRFLYGDFGDTQTTIGSDHGTCYCHHTTRNVNVDLAIWDTAGQERYRSICQAYYHDADAVLMVFDVNDEDSLCAVKDYWSGTLKENLSKPNVPILLVGNKCDGQVASKKVRDRAMRIVESCGFKGFRETSAKEDYEIDAVFETIVSMALESQNFTQHQDIVQLNRQKRRRRSFPFC